MSEQDRLINALQEAGHADETDVLQMPWDENLVFELATNAVHELLTLKEEIEIPLKEKRGEL